MGKTTKAKSTPTKATSASQDVEKAGDVALQWICFGLWEWTLLALSVLLSSTLAHYFVESTSDYGYAVYILAAIVCLLPFALVAEKMYAKREPEQKHGFAGVVMVLNAVVVFLATVAALITAVMSTLSLFVNAHASDGTFVAIISSLVVTVLGLLLFVRIINPPKLRKFSKLFPWLVVAISVATVAAAVAGPFKEHINNREDRFIEDNLSTLNESIRNETNANNRLPASLESIAFDESYEENAKTLVDRKIVTYTPDTKKATQAEDHKTFYYRLCVTFEKQKGNGTSAASSKDLYSLSAHHGDGRQCYNLETDVYSELKRPPVPPEPKESISD